MRKSEYELADVSCELQKSLGVYSYTMRSYADMSYTELRVTKFRIDEVVSSILRGRENLIYCDDGQTVIRIYEKM